MVEDLQQQSKADRVCVGVVTGAHGLKGLIRIKPFTDVPESIASYGAVETEDGSRHLELEVTNRAGKGQVAVRVLGVTDRDMAETLKGQKLYVPRERLPLTSPDEFYYADLIGMTVKTNSEQILGKVSSVYDFGASDVIGVISKSGMEILVPFTKEAVPKIDIKEGYISVSESYIDGISAETPDRSRDNYEQKSN
ncbi:MAG: ribosome maturation factor RimM [Alphaproteobacteria bacterium]|nr:ribosome maturation factor RimM [Alphaproteobacteria bacterium]